MIYAIEFAACLMKIIAVMSNKTKSIFLVLACVMCWALVPVVAKFGQSNLDNHQFLFWSSLVSFLSLLAITALKRKLPEYKSYSIGDWLYVFFLGLLGTYIYYLLLYFGYAETAGMDVLVVQYTWPLMIGVFSVLILKEKLCIKRIAAIILGFLGVIVVLSKGDLSAISISNVEVILWVFAGASCFALYSVLSKKVDKEPLSVVTMYFFAAVIASFLSMFYFSEFAFPSQDDILPIAVNGFLVNGVSYLFWVWALKLSPASFVAPFTFLSPVLAAFYLIVIFDEPMLVAYVVGLALVVTGGVVNSLSDHE